MTPQEKAANNDREFMDEVWKRAQGGFAVKDSGARQSYPTGAVRDTEDGKPRYDLIPLPLLDFLAAEYAKGDKNFRPDLIPHVLIRRLAIHLGKGAIKYGDRNWEKGIPTRRLWSSAWRHFVQAFRGDKDEDHYAATVFNLTGVAHFEDLGGNPADPPAPHRVRPI